jgi:hypothetical protein
MSNNNKLTRPVVLNRKETLAVSGDIFDHGDLGKGVLVFRTDAGDREVVKHPTMHNLSPTTDLSNAKFQ